MSLQLLELWVGFALAATVWHYIGHPPSDWLTNQPLGKVNSDLPFAKDWTPKKIIKKMSGSYHQNFIYFGVS